MPDFVRVDAFEVSGNGPDQTRLAFTANGGGVYFGYLIDASR